MRKKVTKELVEDSQETQGTPTTCTPKEHFAIREQSTGFTICDVCGLEVPYLYDANQLI